VYILSVYRKAYLDESPPPRGDTVTSVHKRRKEVLDRLSRIEGHVRGVRRMVEEERGCPDVLLQIVAVRTALNKVGRIVLEDHVETCLASAVKQGKAERYVSDLTEALSKFL